MGRPMRYATGSRCTSGAPERDCTWTVCGHPPIEPPRQIHLRLHGLTLEQIAVIIARWNAGI